jgi:hypothetical protein
MYLFVELTNNCYYRYFKLERNVHIFFKEITKHSFCTDKRLFVRLYKWLKQKIGENLNQTQFFLC